MDFSIVVNFPTGSDPLHIKSLETNLPHFVHNMANLNGKISFDDLSLQTTNSHINVAVCPSVFGIVYILIVLSVKSVDALTATAQTTNAHIIGNFTTTKELTLTTTNGLVAANVRMRNAASRSTKLTMSTSNGSVNTHIRHDTT